MVKKKLIQIEIDETTFPNLFNIKNNLLGSICYDVFEKGYNSLFPKKDDSLHLDNNISELTDTINNLFGTQSSKKGIMGENFIYNIIKSKFKDITIEITRNKPHNGDGTIIFPEIREKVMLEIKNYTNNVDDTELEKLIYDMQYTNIKFAIFISINSSFVRKPRFHIECYKDLTIIFVPNIIDDINRVENSIVLMKHLINHNNSKFNINDSHKINSQLYKLDEIYHKINKVKSNFIKIEGTIKNQLSEHYKTLRDYEINTKLIIDNIWKNIDIEIEKELNKVDLKNYKSSKLKNLKHIIDILDKKGLYLETNRYDIKDIMIDQCWTLKSTTDSETYGIISNNKGIIDINLIYPVNIKITVSKDKTSLQNSINVLEKLL
jgi:hypothetical protein